MAGVLNVIRAREEVHGEEILSHFLIFLQKAQEARELIKNRELNLFVSRDRLSHRTKIIIIVSIRKSIKRGHCTRPEQECCIMTD